jgi:hypothetical protein
VVAVKSSGLIFESRSISWPSLRTSASARRTASNVKHSSYVVLPNLGNYILGSPRTSATKGGSR